MQEFLMIMLLLTIGAGFVFFIKGVLAIRAYEDFDSIDFIRANGNRLFWAVFGLLLTGLGLFFDPANLQAVFDTLPTGVQLTSPMLAGVAISGLCLMIPSGGDKK